MLAYVLITILLNGALFFVLGGAIHRSVFRRRPENVTGKLPLVLANIAIFNACVGITLWCVVHEHTRLSWEMRAFWWSLAPFVWFHVVTYYVHRFMHTPKVFRWIHSVHHRARSPVFLDAHYMHPLEALYSGVVLVAPAFLFPVHGVAFFAYVAIVGAHELLDHTGVGFSMPLLSPPSEHHRHHRSVRVHYGQLFSLLDRLHRT